MFSSLVKSYVAAWSAFWFWARSLPALIALTWFPLALLSLTSYAWAYARTEAHLAQIEGRASIFTGVPDAGSFDGVLLWAALHLLAFAAACVGVHRFVAVGDKGPSEFLAFPFDKPERAYALMGVIAYAGAIALVIGQYLAQASTDFFLEDLVPYVVRLYGELGLSALNILIWPGELAIFDMPPANYAAWVALVIATGTALIRLSVWPTVVSVEGKLGLADALALTRGRALEIVVYALGFATAAIVVAAILVLIGGVSLAHVGNGDPFAPLRDLIAQSTMTAAVPQGASVETRAVLNERNLALVEELIRFPRNLIAATLGGTLLARLYVHLSAPQHAG